MKNIVPDGLYLMVRLSVAAKVLRMNETLARGLAREGKLSVLQPGGPNAHRFVLPEEIARFADHLGIQAQWEHALNEPV